MSNEDIKKKYIANIKQHLTSHSKSRNVLLKNLNQSIDNYILEHPDLQYSDLEQNFGTPGAIADSYYESLDSAKIYKKPISKKVFIIGLSLLLLGILLFIALKIRHNYYLNREIPTYTIEEYEELKEKGILP